MVDWIESIINNKVLPTLEKKLKLKKFRKYFWWKEIATFNKTLNFETFGD